MIPPRLATVHDAFAYAAARWPERPMLHVTGRTAAAFGVEAGPLTYAGAMAEVSALAAAYSAAGYGEGARVGLLLENRPAFFLHWLALNALGASVLPINPDLKRRELAYLIGHAEPCLIVATPERRDMLAGAAGDAGVDLAVIAPDGSPPAPRPDSAVAAPEAGASREAAILYTSGTTGAPKGCVLSNDYFLEAGRWYAAAGGLCDLSLDGERMLTPLPVFHMNAMAYSFMAMIAVGGCLIALDRFHPSTWWAEVAESRATCLHYLGVMPTMLMAADDAPEDRAHDVRFGFGAGIDAKLQAGFEGRFGFPLIEAWAMTETGAGAVIAANGPDRPVGVSCLGRPGETVEARIVADDGGDAEQGELLVRRAGDDPRRGFFSRYHKDPDATAEAWTDGWFHTGDIVRRDGEGYLYFVDRKKNVIRRSGENIAAVEVESLLLRHPSVRAVAVAPVPDDMRGEEVFACVVADDPSPEAAEDIQAHALREAAYHKAPAYIAFVDALPVTATQKLQRGEIRALALRLRDDPATFRLGHLKKRSAA